MKSYIPSRYIPKRYKMAYLCSICLEMSYEGRRCIPGFICASCQRKVRSKARHIANLREAEQIIREGSNRNVVQETLE